MTTWLLISTLFNFIIRELVYTVVYTAVLS